MALNEITMIQPQGFCSGVVKSIQMVQQLRKDNPDVKITVLGWLVHNEHVISDLEKMRIDTIDDKGKDRLDLIDQIDEGVVILTAHGTNPKVKLKALKKGLQVIDTTCVYVKQIETNILQAINDGYEVIYIGKRTHPETVAALSLNPSIIFIEKVEDLDKLDKTKKYYATNQTTLSIIDIEDIYQKLENNYDVVIDNEICLATNLRQRAVLDLRGCTLVVVVGDKRSNNSLRLVDVAKSCGMESVLISEPSEVNKAMLMPHRMKIGLTGGASTPKKIIDAVKSRMEELLDTE